MNAAGLLQKTLTVGLAILLSLALIMMLCDLLAQLAHWYGGLLPAGKRHFGWWMAAVSTVSMMLMAFNARRRARQRDIQEY